MPTFLQTFGGAFGTKKVIRIKDLGLADEERVELECILHPDKANFAVDAPVFEGNYLEIPDPRDPATPQLKYVAKVEIYDTPKMANMAHLAATLSDEPPRSRPAEPRIVNNTSIVVHGGNNQFAVGNLTGAQAMTIAEGVTGELSALATRVAAIVQDVELLEIGADEREAILTTSKSLLDEIASDDPDMSLVRRLGVFLKNALAGAVYATGAGASQAIRDFVYTHLDELLSTLPPT